MNYLVKQSNGKEFQYTSLPEALDGFVDNFDENFKSTLVGVSNQSSLVLITYDHTTEVFKFHRLVAEQEKFFMDKMETKLESLGLLF